MFMVCKTYTSTAGFSNPSVQINSTLNSWWGRAKQYGVTDPQNKYTDANLYTFANCHIRKEIDFGFSGYYTNGVMWQTGTACTNAADCTTYANSGCAAGLCTKGADIPGTGGLFQ
ncbi:hypothetical protein ANCDUO_20052 [Ancylostoma duodenale]|uniref:SCP domain-containing protein n=1 Tax=Ancylostoma duodenale TaxID=51022 RepID=A0A0C2CJD4_9BILA|nr:hypothetical protein ANCDUO_20052 [Ancylostoma duodenale]